MAIETSLPLMIRSHALPCRLPHSPPATSLGLLTGFHRATLSSDPLGGRVWASTRVRVHSRLGKDRAKATKIVQGSSLLPTGSAPAPYLSSPSTLACPASSFPSRALPELTGHMQLLGHHCTVCAWLDFPLAPDTASESFLSQKSKPAQYQSIRADTDIFTCKNSAFTGHEAEI